MQLLPRKRKRLGQHWLKDEKALAGIVRAGQVGADDTVLEIGPGLGTLTTHLVKSAGKVVAVEKDKKLAERLSVRLNNPKLKVIEGDILQFDLTKLPSHYKVIANIPYYLTGKLLRLMTQTPNPPSTIVLLIQKEVAERLAAKPGDMSLLSVVIQLFYEPQLGPKLPAKLFEPPPKVDSRVIILARRAFPLFKDLDTKLFFRVVKAGFSAPRKKLRSSLAGGLGIGKGEVDKLLEEAEINGGLRPEALSLQQWHAIYMQLKVKNDLHALLR